MVFVVCINLYLTIE
jgi:hypothetical protein